MRYFLNTMADILAALATLALVARCAKYFLYDTSRDAAYSTKHFLMEMLPYVLLAVLSVWVLRLVANLLACFQSNNTTGTES